MKRMLASLAVALGALGGVLTASELAQAAGTASVTVVHGIPNTPVNVFVNGKDVLPNFKPGTVAGPLPLPPGSYQVKIFPASNTAGTGAPVIQASATLSAGENVSLAAHLSATGTPTLTPFVNDVSRIPVGKARLVVRHTAAAPAVDVRANGQVAFKSLTNPNQAAAVLPAGAVKADVVLAGTPTVVIGPASLNLAAGDDTIVYAIGSANAKTLSLVVQTITGLGAAPSGAPAGSGGYAAPVTPSTPLWVWLSVAAGGLIAVAGAASATKRTMSSRR